MQDDRQTTLSPPTDVPVAELHAVYVAGGDGWVVAWLEDIPGVVTQGATLAEAQVNLRDALRLILASHREERRDDAASQTVVYRETLTIS